MPTVWGGDEPEILNLVHALFTGTRGQMGILPEEGFLLG